MYEDSLVFALDEMQNDHGHREVLRGGQRRRGGVEVWSQEEGDGEVNEDWTKVFDDEDCRPG